ncbi:MAG: alkaline phosphatase family protein [Clostridia bacterium]|nr:alkaline phosphatase family protein [Clostridia bacterium]MBQ8720110.1 alkaline phosphatase family protein [Clostridia bacterium]
MKKLISLLLLLSVMCTCILTSCGTTLPDSSDGSSSDETGGETEGGENTGGETEGGENTGGETEGGESTGGETEGDEDDDTQNGDNDNMTDENTKYKYVVVIGVDGAGSFFRNTDTPNIDAIFEKGAITYNCLTANPTISAQCWGSLLHGVTPSVHGLTNSIAGSHPYPTDSKFPSFFRVIRENDANATLASFSHWNSINVGIIENGIDVYKATASTDSALTDAIVAYIGQNNPTALFVQFDEADGAGHSSGYGTATQLAKITEIDAYIGQIYDAYKQKGILDETLFIVTSDHGGSGTSHGGLTDAEKYVMFAASGKTVQNGEIQDIEIRDTAAIVLHALGYTAPETWTARVPSGLFEGVTAGERPVYVDKDSIRYHENEPTPTEESEGYVTNFIKNHELSTYLKFDGDITDACGGNTTKTGNLYFIEGYYGQGVAVDDGYISINDYAPGTNSFTIAFWIDMENPGSDADPAIFSNKDWDRAKNLGITLASRFGTKFRFNIADGINRVDCDVELPADYADGWMHVICIIDREANKLSLCCDFGVLTSVDIPSGFASTSLTSAYPVLNIGQDAAGDYSYSLPATIDEFMIFDGVFTREDIYALAEYYGKDVSSSPDFRNNEPAATPTKDSDGYITNYITDKELTTYLTFDGNVNDSTEKSSVSAKGSVSYEDGFFGQGINLSEGYVSIADITPGTESFSVAFWMKTDGVTGDPILVSNKDWSTGKNAGFAISLRDANDLRVDLADGTNRSKGDPLLPEDYQQGWVYVIVVYDRENSEIRVSYDFGEFKVYKISDSLANVSANGCTEAINIGQDGTGSYDDSLTATIDEFMLFKGALDNDDIKSLAEYFGVADT